MPMGFFVCLQSRFIMTSSKSYDGLTEKEKDNMLDLIFHRVPLEEFEIGGMHPIHFAKLKGKNTLLVKKVDTAACVMDYLFEKGILTQEDKDNIMLPNSTTEDQNRKLLDKLPRKGPKAFVQFRQGLMENPGCQWVVDELDNVSGLHDGISTHFLKNKYQCH